MVCVHQIIYAFRNLVYAEVTAVVNLQRLILTTMLGGDDDHTITSTRTVDGTGSGILQNLDGLNIISGEVTDRSTHWHSIDNIKRCGTSKSTDTTNTHRWIGTRLTIGRDLYTRNLTLKHGGDIGVGYLLQLVGIDNGNRAGQVGLLLSTITDNDNLIQNTVISCHLNLINNSASTHSNLAVFIAYITYHERSIGRSVKIEITVKIGHSTTLSTFYLNGGSSKRFTLIVYDLAFHLNRL